jgi:hypothetical protein
MKRSSTIRLGLVAGLLTACLGWGFRRPIATWWEAGHGAAAGERSSSLADSNRPRLTRTGARDPKDVQAAIAAWQQRLVTAHPELAVDYREVPDADNRLLQILAFIDNGFEGTKLSDLPGDIFTTIQDPDAWDSDRFGEWLAQHRDLMKRMIELGTLPDSSARSMDYMKFAENCTQIGRYDLLLAADIRYSLEKGDQAAALAAMAAAKGFAHCFEDQEAPTLLSTIVAYGSFAKQDEIVLQQILGSDDLDTAQLTAWRRAASHPVMSAEDLSRLQRGEWWALSQIAMNGVLTHSEGLPGFHAEGDPEGYMEKLSTYSSAQIAWATHSSLGERLGSESFGEDPRTFGIDEESAKGLNSIQGKIYQGIAVAEVKNAMIDAAFAIALGETPPDDPATGKPFIVDEATHSLLLPDDPAFGNVNMEPVKIPVVR